MIMSDSQPKREPSVAATKRTEAAIPSSNPPRGANELPADTVAEGMSTAAAETFAAETDQGFRGFKSDPTPRENYTLAGVNAGLPTPETVVVTPTR
jgi:hypothetical protein